MSYTLTLRPAVKDQIVSMHPFLKKEIRTALELIEENPQDGKKLEEDLVGFYSWKVRRHHIIYQINQKKIEVVALGHRSSIYDIIDKKI